MCLKQKFCELCRSWALLYLQAGQKENQSKGKKKPQIEVIQGKEIAGSHHIYQQHYCSNKQAENPAEFSF